MECAPTDSRSMLERLIEVFEKRSRNHVEDHSSYGQNREEVWSEAADEVRRSLQYLNGEICSEDYLK